MSLSLPRILFEDKYKGTWEFRDSWYPEAKENAPQEIIDALRKFREEGERTQDANGNIIMV